MSQNDDCAELQLENQLCFALHSTSLMMTKVYKPFLKALGLTYPQYLAMLVLWENDGLTVGEMSRKLLTDPGSLTPLLKRLEAEGAIKRTRRSTDERVVELRLTPEGKAMREIARTIPSCIAGASDRSFERLMALRDELVALREELRKSL
ncbi:hydroperoxide stress response transcriptional regulator OhrR [Marinobacter nanhaiticus D15-8W]|uniref:MarR family transcriptional regulator n=1 Tax=Marinobacter nanhaiticus D15-8W TaxID=626887 RepID=N6WNC8_9GAMM|nr:MarR family transcriptional regulator [Marinobacter nanhaiticus]ENO13021.1 MarR family transcriptional regulator [Marinobacter nanhaiticus D15-8W]BES70375.1 hydroperoxide stress response transcriptional regulator OhrR [Marinobacter nanhaiticus D15-8W]